MVQINLSPTGPISHSHVNASQQDGMDAGPDVSQKDGAKGTDKPLDVIFLQDTTGSQGPYISAARKAIRDICDKISSSGDLAKELIRFGLIAFRDHPPQDTSYVTKNFGFTSDMSIMQKNLASLIASGGGDGPEAQTAALADALNAQWSEDAVKIVILITDAPPHGLGEPGDGFDASPDQNDPLEIARQMAERGMTLFVIACEPGLSRYKHALDFYTALTGITSGRVFPAFMADKLDEYIVGTVIETIETEKLIGEFEEVIMDDVYVKETPMETVAQNLQQFVQARGGKLTTMLVEDIYVPSDTAAKNTSVWGNSTHIRDARGMVQEIRGSRIQQQYQQQAHGGWMPPISRGKTLGEREGDRERDGERERDGCGSDREWDDCESDCSSDDSSDHEIDLGMRPRGRVGPLSTPRNDAPQQQQQQQQMPSITLAKQDFSQMQARRIVAQAVSRNSKVASGGVFSRGGQQVQLAPSMGPGSSS